MGKYMINGWINIFGYLMLPLNMYHNDNQLRNNSFAITKPFNNGCSMEFNGQMHLKRGIIFINSGPNYIVVLNKPVGLIFCSPFIGENESGKISNLIW